jgi:hypothetical protein
MELDRADAAHNRGRFAYRVIPAVAMPSSCTARSSCSRHPLPVGYCTRRDRGCPPSAGRYRVPGSLSTLPVAPNMPRSSRSSLRTWRLFLPCVFSWSAERLYPQSLSARLWALAVDFAVAFVLVSLAFACTDLINTSINTNSKRKALGLRRMTWGIGMASSALPCLRLILPAADDNVGHFRSCWELTFPSASLERCSRR